MSSIYSRGVMKTLQLHLKNCLVMCNRNDIHTVYDHIYRTIIVHVVTSTSSSFRSIGSFIRKNIANDKLTEAKILNQLMHYSNM